MVEELSISEAFELFRIEHIVYLNQSGRTEEMHLCARNSLIKYAGNIPVSSLTFDIIRKWKQALEKDMTQNTVRGYIIKLRMVLKHLSKRGYNNVLNHEMVGVPKRADKVVSFLEIDEVNRLIDEAFRPVAGYKTENRYRNRAIVGLLYSSGIRISELCSLDIDSLRDDKTFTLLGKGGKARLCFFDDRAKEYIDDYLAVRSDCDPALFVSAQNGKRIKKDNVQLMFRNLRSKCGFKKAVTPHTMRHTFATDLLRNNTNLVYVRDFLGHSDIQTTAMYTHVVNEDLKAIYREKHTV